MNLDSFEDSISPQITLLRGLVYYQEDTVLSLEMGEPNRYTAFVKGSTIYQVSLTLDDQREVSEMACTCPYDWGDYCKHEVAVLYALRCQLDRGEDVMVEGPALVDLRSLLEGVSKEALLDFLVGYATRSPALVTDLVIAFPSSDEETNLTNLGIQFRHACKHGTECTSYGSDYSWEDDDGQVFWQFSSTFKKKIEENKEMIRSSIKEGRIRYAGSIASMMVHELSFLDSDIEQIGEDVEAAVCQIASLFDEVMPSADDASVLFSKFFTEAENYDIAAQATLLRLCIHFADAESDQEVLKNYLFDLASGETESEWAFNCTLMHSVELRYALLLKQQRLEEAQVFALENLTYDSMRKLAFDHAMEAKDYVLAESLALGKGGTGRRLSAGIRWDELLFRVYEESGNTIEKRNLAKAFLLQGKFAYYTILKECYEEEEWNTIVDGLLDELEACNGANKAYRTSTYVDVLKAEKNLKRLLSYMQGSPYWVQDYQDVLLPSYQGEVFALYKRVILAKGESSSHRDEYRDLASWLESLVSIGGVAVAKECLGALEQRYKKRPAMKDELRKAGVL